MRCNGLRYSSVENLELSMEIQTTFQLSDSIQQSSVNPNPLTGNNSEPGYSEREEKKKLFIKVIKGRQTANNDKYQPLWNAGKNVARLTKYQLRRPEEFQRWEKQLSYLITENVSK